MSAGAWRWLRRLSQIASLAAAGALVVVTTYPLERDLPYDLLPRLSPLLGITAMIAGRAIITAAWPALVVLGLTLLFGRAFCGWVCPLGTLLDAGDFIQTKLLRRRRREGNRARHRQWRVLLLLALVIFAAFGISLAGWFDPLSLFPRTLAASVTPYFLRALDKTTLCLYKVPALEGIVGAARQRLLPENVTLFPGHLIITAVFVGLLALGLVRRRFYCRYVCPTGALLAVVGWASPFGRRVDAAACSECKLCRHVCRMGAVGDDGLSTRQAECNLCLDCLPLCRREATSFGFGRKRPAANATAWAPAVTRRSFLFSTGGSLVAAPAVLALDSRLPADPFLIRPPGAPEESDFLGRCVRCGECIKVCLTQGLVPVHLEAGLTGLWTPKLLPRQGYCEYLCTLCTHVCPSNALRALTEEEKKIEVIGLAVIDRDRCLPWAEDEDCNVCEEMCPTAPKAIELKGRRRLQPYVIPERCVGCGICDYACPVEGLPSAIPIVRDETVAHVVAGSVYATRRRRRRGRSSK